MAENWQLKAVLSANAAGMVKALGDVSKMAKSTRKYLADVANSAGNLANRVGLPTALGTGLLAGFGVAAVKNAMLGLADMEDQVSKFSATTGIAGSEFKKFQYLAKLSNVPFESLTGSMGKLNKQIFDAANGKGKDLAGLFSHLGINLRDSNGQLRSAADMLPQLADAFERNENPVVRARMGMALFGKSWQEIMPMLADGSDKINQRMARFKELGLEVKDVDAFKKQMDEAGKFGDALDDLSFVSNGLQTTIASALVPSITPLLVQLTNWVAENKEIIKNDVAKAAKALAQQLKGIKWEDVRAGLKAIKDSIKWFVDGLGGARNALIALVVVMNFQTITALFSLGAALVRGGFAFYGFAASAVASSGALGMAGVAIRAIGMAIATTPLGIVLALAGAALLIWQNWDTLKSWFSSFFDWIGDKFKMLVGWAVDLAKTAASIFGGGGSMDYRQIAGAATSPASAGPGVASRPSLIGGQQVKASGQIEVSFRDAPPGMRVEQAKNNGDIPVRTDVGYRAYAMGMP